MLETRLAMLAELAVAFLQLDSAGMVIECALQNAAKVINIDFIAGHLVGDDGGLQLIAARGVFGGSVDPIVDHLAGAVCRDVALTGRPRLIDEHTTWDDPAISTARKTGLGAFACFPLRAGDGLIGTLAFGSRRYSRYEPDEIELMEVVTNYAAIAITGTELRLRQHRITEALRHRRAFFERVLEHIPGGWVAVIDRDLRALAVERGVEAAVAGPHLVESSLDELFDDAAAAVARPHLLRALAGEQVEFELRLRERVYSVTAAPLDRDGPAIASVVVAAHDISERIAREQALARSEERYRLIASATTTSLWHHDFWTGRSSASEALALVFGHSADDPALKNDGYAWWLQQVHPDDRERVSALFLNAFAGDAAECRAEYRFRRGDGSYAWVRDIAVIVRDSTGRAKYVNGATIDITAQRQAHEALREENRRQDQFIATVAHELRQPLTAMTWALGLLPTASADGDQRRHALDVLSRQVQHLAHLVDDLGYASTITAGRLALQPKLVDLRTIAADAVDLVRPEALAKRITISQTVSSMSHDVYGDPVRLRQILSNLLTNAVKFTPEHGEVRLLVESEGRDVVVRVHDTGPGFDPAVLPGMFELFAHASPATGGLGIGLAVARRLAEAHGGSIEAHNLDAGAALVVRLPLVKRRQTPRA
jgi:PAS domain S-box-containing protein